MLSFDRPFWPPRFYPHAASRYSLGLCCLLEFSPSQAMDEASSILHSRPLKRNCCLSSDGPSTRWPLSFEHRPSFKCPSNQTGYIRLWIARTPFRRFLTSPPLFPSFHVRKPTPKSWILEAWKVQRRSEPQRITRLGDWLDSLKPADSFRLSHLVDPQDPEKTSPNSRRLLSQLEF